jgi:hypothetical protein
MRKFVEYAYDIVHGDQSRCMVKVGGNSATLKEAVHLGTWEVMNLGWKYEGWCVNIFYRS